jgi:3-oxoacyl-[acyl-carrier protein] reductase
MQMNGRVCVVTGAASGIGRASAELLADRGARVTAVDLDDVEGTRIVERLGGSDRALFVKADLTNPDDIKEVAAGVLGAFEHIDVLVNCAGIGSLTGVPDVTSEEWDTVFAVNLKATFFLTQRVLSHMVERRRGTIISLSSASAKIGGIAVGPHYSASKAGIICLTKSLALYGAPYGITANCVCPGPTETPMTDVWGEKLNTEFAAKIPLKRYATASEVAETVCFLASDGAAYITGETIDVNGGLVMD